MQSTVAVAGERFAASGGIVVRTIGIVGA